MDLGGSRLTGLPQYLGQVREWCTVALLSSFSRCTEKTQVSYLHEKNGVEYDERFCQSAGNIGVLVQAEHTRSRRHGHSLNAFHVAAVRVFLIVVDRGIHTVVVEAVV